MIERVSYIDDGKDWYWASVALADLLAEPQIRAGLDADPPLADLIADCRRNLHAGEKQRDEMRRRFPTHADEFQRQHTAGVLMLQRDILAMLARRHLINPDHYRVR